MGNSLDKALQTLDSSDLPLQAERLRPGLHARILGRAGVSDRPTIRVLNLVRGHADLRIGDIERRIEGPSLVWLPWSAEHRLQLSASAQGTHLLLGTAAIERALHHRPEAATLRFISERATTQHFADDTSAAQAVESCLDGIVEESRRPGPLGAAVIDSLLHVLLILIYRGQSQAARVEARASQTVASRFDALVEAHFRDHWSVARYARTLGVSRDRLNDICLRVFDQPPGGIIRKRMHREARLYLENSTLALDQIASLLGFSGTPNFHRFFKAQEGTTPGRYRKRLTRTASAPQALTRPYQWP